MANNQHLDQHARQRRHKLARRAYIYQILIILVAVGGYLLVSALTSKESTHPADTEADRLLETVLPEGTPEIKVRYTGFDVSFNPEKHVPNYVAWELTGEEADGQEPRNSNFRPDTGVEGCAQLEDYRKSGFDRGHMAPAADLKWSAEAMSDSHYLTNICPQTHELNTKRWGSLEKKCREWARRDSAIIIIAGPVLTDYLPHTIGPNKVVVPERFFKVIAAPYADPPRAIAFIMPNFPPFDPLYDMAVSVDQLEEITGIDFLSALPDDIENEIESQANIRVWDRNRR